MRLGTFFHSGMHNNKSPNSKSVTTSVCSLSEIVCQCFSVSGFIFMYLVRCFNYLLRRAHRKSFHTIPSVLPLSSPTKKFMNTLSLHHYLKYGFRRFFLNLSLHLLWVFGATFFDLPAPYRRHSFVCFLWTALEPSGVDFRMSPQIRPGIIVLTFILS